LNASGDLMCPSELLTLTPEPIVPVTPAHVVIPVPESIVQKSKSLKIKNLPRASN